MLCRTAGSSQEEGNQGSITSSDTDTTTKKHFMILQTLRKTPMLQDSLSETGGADIINILRKATMS